MSLMLAASKPCVRNTERAPTIIWRLLLVSAAAAVAPSETVRTSDIASFPRIAQRQSEFSLQELVTEPFGHLDVCRAALYVKSELTEPFGQIDGFSVRWVEAK